jgi:predicted  nucleic acid-binding Zn-ribbon protein
LFNFLKEGLDVPDTSIKDQIHRLVALQKIDSEIYDLKTQLQEKPAVVGDLKKGFEGKKARLQVIEEKIKSVQAKRKETELDLKGKEDSITKANAQLSELKTNREYSAKLTEIENIKADKSILEEKVLLSFDESDRLSGDAAAERGRVAEEERVYLQKKKEVDEEVKVINERVKALEGQRKELIPGVDAAILPRYEQLIDRRQGLAIVQVISGNECGGCHMDVTMQQINAIKIGEGFVHCEFCNRILYLEDYAE